jgi:hypothetical protein
MFGKRARPTSQPKDEPIEVLPIRPEPGPENAVGDGSGYPAKQKMCTCLRAYAYWENGLCWDCDKELNWYLSINGIR